MEILPGNPITHEKGSVGISNLHRSQGYIRSAAEKHLAFQSVSRTHKKLKTNITMSLPQNLGHLPENLVCLFTRLSSVNIIKCNEMVAELIDMLKLCGNPMTYWKIKQVRSQIIGLMNGSITLT